MADENSKIHTAIAISGDPAGTHGVTLITHGVAEHLVIGGHFGDALAAHPLVARAMELFRSAAALTAANAPPASEEEAAPVPEPEPEPVEVISPPFDGMQRYQSSKVVRAGQIVTLFKPPFGAQPTGAYVANADGQAVLRPFLAGMTARYMPQVGDYWVVYEDGYQSISPQQPFVEGYTPLPPAPTDLSGAGNGGGTPGPAGAAVPEQPAQPAVMTDAPAGGNAPPEAPGTAPGAATDPAAPGGQPGGV